MRIKIENSFIISPLKNSWLPVWLIEIAIKGMGIPPTFHASFSNKMSRGTSLYYLSPNTSVLIYIRHMVRGKTIYSYDGYENKKYWDSFVLPDHDEDGFININLKGPNITPRQNHECHLQYRHNNANCGAILKGTIESTPPQIDAIKETVDPAAVPKKYYGLRWIKRFRRMFIIAPRNSTTYYMKYLLEIIFFFLLGFNIKTWMQVYHCYQMASLTTLQSVGQASMCSSCPTCPMACPQVGSVKNNERVRRAVLRDRPPSVDYSLNAISTASGPSRIIFPLSLDNFLLHKERSTPDKNLQEMKYQLFDDFYLYDTFGNEPRIPIPGYHKKQKSHLTSHLVNKVNQLEISERKWELQKVMNGYAKYEPGYGIDYIIDFRVRRPKVGKGLEFELKRAHLFQPLNRVELTGYHEIVEPTHEQPEIVPEKVHLIVPIAGRDIETRFDNFLRQFSNVARLNVKLWLILSAQATPDSVELDINLKVRDFVESSKIIYGSTKAYDIEIIPIAGPFSRGASLHYGAMQVNKGGVEDALLFFCDVDMKLSPQFVRRCRSNTQPGESVYYPLVFSQYDPEVVREFSSTPQHMTVDSLGHIHRDTGHWVDYGFGLVCLYKSDYVSVGGFNLNISGWGAEDVDLYEKHVRSHIRVFRAMDPDLVHVYHDRFCDSRLNEEQYTMCLDTKSESYGSRNQLGRKILMENLLNKLVTRKNPSTFKTSPKKLMKKNQSKKAFNKNNKKIGLQKQSHKKGNQVSIEKSNLKNKVRKSKNEKLNNGKKNGAAKKDNKVVKTSKPILGSKTKNLSRNLKQRLKRSPTLADLIKLRQALGKDK